MATFFLEGLFLVLLLLNSSIATRIDSTTDNIDGFSLDLIHRHSPNSPLHDPSLTLYHHARQMVHQSASRHRYLTSRFLSSSSSRSPSSTPSPSPPPISGFQSLVTKDPGEYIMRFGIGTPLQKYWAILDTGSDLTWIQCKPCTNCFNQSTPIFDPHNSSTYKTLGCKSKACVAFDNGYCSPQKICKYSYGYNDQSVSTGFLASETFTFESADGRNVKFRSTAFGCGHSNYLGGLPTEGTGVFGLGRGPLSLVSQLGNFIQHRFSYCFHPWNETNSVSWIKFGSHATYSGTGKVQSTPITASYSTNYFISLEDISVGSKRLHIPKDDFASTMLGGGMIIDSGTTLTFLKSNVYDKVASAVKEVVKFPVDNGPPNWSLCFKVKDSEKLDGFPELTFHFQGGADWNVPPSNAFLPITGTMVCLTLHPSSSGLSIFGNLAQQNFHVEYDLRNNKLNFAQTECTKRK